MADLVPSPPHLVRRYLRGEDKGNPFDERDTMYDVFYVDRLSGREVLRYDAADPANTNASYGAVSDTERFARRGLDIDEAVEASACLVKPDPGEAERYAAKLARKTEQERQEAEACELYEVVPEAMKHFSFERWREDEGEVLRPALEAMGYTDVSFYMVEQDSFGPLIRGCVATKKGGARVRFLYG